MTATKYVAELRGRSNDRLARVLALLHRLALISAAAFAICLCLSSTLVANRIINAPEVAGLLAIGAAAVFFIAMDSYQQGALIGFEAARRCAFANVLSSLGAIPLTLLLTASIGVWGAVLGYVATSALQYTTSRWYLLRTMEEFHISPSDVHWLSEIAVLPKFAIPALLAAAMVAPAHWLCHLMLLRLPDGKNQLALYTVAIQWFQALSFLPGAAGRIVLPILSDMTARHDLVRARTLLNRTTAATSLFAIPLALVLVFLSPWLLQMYGPAFVAGSMTFGLVITAATLSTISNPVGQMLAARNRMWVALGMNFGWATVYVGMATLLVPFGALGVAVSLAGAYLFHLILVFSWAKWEADDRTSSNR